MHADNYDIYGQRKVHAQLVREGIAGHGGVLGVILTSALFSRAMRMAVDAARTRPLGRDGRSSSAALIVDYSNQRTPARRRFLLFIAFHLDL